MRGAHHDAREVRGMSKGRTRTPITIRRHREPDASGGGEIDLERCGRRKVSIRSERSAAELRAMGRAYLHVDEQRSVVIRRVTAVVAVVTRDVAQLRRCLEDGVRFEADLAALTERGGLSVPVRPLAPR